MKSIKKYLNKRDIFQARKIDEKTIFYIFKKIIKEEFGNIGEGKLKPEYYKNKTIFIKSESSVWASELWINKERVIKRINIEIGESVVEKIKI